MNNWILATTAAGALAILMAVLLTTWITKQDAGNDRMKEIAGYIREGAMAFLKREYTYMVVIMGILFIIILVGLNFMVGFIKAHGSKISTNL